ncbi:hypothetical protein Q3V23_00325 [Streptomyces sp. VNUA116]|uniref:hypothetical protein n=1 Tax=Streptomyces sp. VNUA116 TaxID=3062449 RepID=UPI0026758E5A|nr:hypothetical protein [Streptomyces sp. VNUA116]WKU42643.1 hypothetical protein Q3V23_00325 [Streptomyces sp. VNUA116]
MIKPHRISVSRLGRHPNRRIWVYFDTQLLVEMKPATARDLAYALADETGLGIFPAEPGRARILRRTRALLRRTLPRMSRGASHARR